MKERIKEITIKCLTILIVTAEVIVISPLLIPMIILMPIFCWVAGLMDKKEGEDYFKPMMVGDKNWTNLFDKK